MILVADSGSTKCDWVLLSNRQPVVQTATIGFNPFYHSVTQIIKELTNEEQLKKHATAVTAVYFYGAGCSSPERNKIIAAALGRIFTQATIDVKHDVLGAAIAANNGKPGIACILGTGSNSCYFDGVETSEVLPSLGYILGDEGGGAWFGKQLVTDYLYKQPLPSALQTELENGGFEKESILQSIYMKPHPNVYLASFTKILAKHIQTAYVSNLIATGMRAFLEKHVCCFKGYQNHTTNFVGSVAFHFKGILEQECKKLNIQIGNVIQKPIDGLVAYHAQH